MMATGIDVSKAMLDVSMAAGPVHRFENSASNIRRWLRHSLARIGDLNSYGSGAFEPLSPPYLTFGV